MARFSQGFDSIFVVTYFSKEKFDNYSGLRFLEHFEIKSRLPFLQPNSTYDVFRVKSVADLVICRHLINYEPVSNGEWTSGFSILVAQWSGGHPILSHHS